MPLFPLPPLPCTPLVEEVAPNIIRLNTADFPEIDYGHEERSDYQLIGWVHGDARLAATGAMMPEAHQAVGDHQRLMDAANRAMARWWRSAIR